MYQITVPYDLDGIHLIITADIEPGEPGYYFGRPEDCSPSVSASIDSVKVEIVEGKRREEIPSLMVDQMREKWDLDQEIWDAAEEKIERSLMEAAMDKAI